MNPTQFRFPWLCAAMAAALLVLTSCSAPTPKPGETFACASASDITQTIAKEASLENFACVMKEWEGETTLHFMVAVKNVSDQDQRFKVNIFLENGKAVGGLLPRKTKNGLMKPGQTLEFTYPVKGVGHARVRSRC